MLDSQEKVGGARYRAMGTRETGGREAPIAQRLRQLRSVESDTSAAFAVRLRMSTQRWNNFENGYPLSREVAFTLVQTIPGLTLDWLYFGKLEGLTVDLARRLGELPSENMPKRKA